MIFLSMLLNLLEPFLLPNQLYHFPVYQGDLGSNRRLFLYIMDKLYILFSTCVVKGSVNVFLFFKAVSADKESVKIMNSLWLIVIIWSSAKSTAIISAIYMEAIFEILFRFYDLLVCQRIQLYFRFLLHLYIHEDSRGILFMLSTLDWYMAGLVWILDIW